MLRLLSVLVLILLLPLSACDSDEGPSGSEVDGRYRATAYTFTQEQGTLIGTVDVLSYMEVDGGEPVFTVDLFGQDEEYTLAYQLAAEDSRSSVRGSFSTESNNRVRLLEADPADPDAPRILLPLPLTLTSSADRVTLTASQVTTVTFEELAALDPDEFGGLSGGFVRGRVQLTFVRE